AVSSRCPALTPSVPPRREPMFRVVVGLLVCSVTPPVLAQGPAKESDPPILVKGGQPPIIGVVEGVQDGKLLVRQHRPETRTATRTKPVRQKVVIDGKEQEKTEYITEAFSFTAMAPYSVAHDMAKVRVFDTNGAPIAANRIAALFSQPRMVLMAT